MRMCFASPAPSSTGWAPWCGLGLAAVFLVSGAIKAIDPGQTRVAVGAYELLTPDLSARSPLRYPWSRWRCCAPDGNRSIPAGYSTLAAGGSFCAAKTGIFPRFHDSLYGTQPEEGGRGWTSAEIQQLGRVLGAGDSFARCV